MRIVNHKISMFLLVASDSHTLQVLCEVIADTCSDCYNFIDNKGFNPDTVKWEDLCALRNGVEIIYKR